METNTSLSFRLHLERFTSIWLSWYYQVRYRNLTLEPGVRIAGRLKRSGSVRVTIHGGTCIRKRNHNLVVGPGCIFRHDVSANIVVIGNPERIVKHLKPQEADLLMPGVQV